MGCILLNNSLRNSPGFRLRQAFPRSGKGEGKYFAAGRVKLSLSQIRRRLRIWDRLFQKFAAKL